MRICTLIGEQSNSRVMARPKDEGMISTESFKPCVIQMSTTREMPVIRANSRSNKTVKNSSEWIRCIHLGQQLEQCGRSDLAETFYKRAVQLAIGAEPAAD